MSAPDIGAMLERAYAGMDKDGFFPPTPCKACGTMLSGADGPRPAETYAGTATGLCYGCERGGPYVVPDSELPDGARRVSWPPACPSWRRDRTEHWAYPDCEDCKGKGARMRCGHNGQWTEFCRPCMKRVMAPRKSAEVQLLADVADALEGADVVGTGTPSEVVAAALRPIVTAALSEWAETPTVWRPTVTVLRVAESRLKPAQLRAKRADTLRRHVVAALRAEAEERSGKSAC